MSYNTSILGDIEILGYACCRHYGIEAQNSVCHNGNDGDFFLVTTLPIQPSDKVSALYYFFQGQTLQRLDYIQTLVKHIGWRFKLIKL